MQSVGTGPVRIARMMMERHGYCAQAVASERANEARLAADTAGLDRWQMVLRAIAELRRTAPAPAQ